MTPEESRKGCWWERCGDIHLCSYREGYEDGWEAAVEAVGQLRLDEKGMGVAR